MLKNIELAKQWLSKAMNDLLDADNNLKAEVVPFDTVCFHCQQAAEKFLKAYLVGNGQQYPFTHDLLLIMERILPFNSEVDELRDSCAILIPYAVEIRYPDDWYIPSEEDAKEAREAVSKVLSWLENALPDIFTNTEKA